MFILAAWAFCAVAGCYKIASEAQWDRLNLRAHQARSDRLHRERRRSYMDENINLELVFTISLLSLFSCSIIRISYV